MLSKPGFEVQNSSKHPPYREGHVCVVVLVVDKGVITEHIIRPQHVEPLSKQHPKQVIVMKAAPKKKRKVKLPLLQKLRQKIENLPLVKRRRAKKGKFV